MKYIVFLGDGMADRPLDELGGKTPLQAAVKPNIDYLAEHGMCGMVKTVPDGMTPGSDVANLAVMGFDVRKVYSGRAPLEALSIGVRMNDTDVAMRCNLVTLSDEADFTEKRMLDYSAGEITTAEAHELIEAVQEALGDETFNFYGGVSYRNCLIIKDGKVQNLIAPHDISGEAIGEYLPSDVKLRELTERSYAILSKHPVNIKRLEDGKNPANSIWLWGAGTKPALPAFEELYGMKGAVISAVDLLKGIAIGADMKVIEVEGATGRLDTNWDGKAKAAVEALRDGYDYVYIHMEAPDECGHQGDVNGKIEAIESVDRLIGNVLGEIDADVTVLVTPDHPTPIGIRTHSSDAVPFIIYSVGNEQNSGIKSYGESECESTGVAIANGEELMKALLAYGVNDCEQSSETNSITVAEVDSENTDDNVDITDKGVVTDVIADGESAEREFEESEENVTAVDEENVEESFDEEKESETGASLDAFDEESGEMILPDELPEISGEEINDEEVALGDVESADAAHNKKKFFIKGKKKKDKKSKKSNQDESVDYSEASDDGYLDEAEENKGKKNKTELTSKQKKNRIIAISIAAALLVIIIVLSIVLPIVILNKGKIFVKTADDFNNVDKGSYFVLEKDILVEGDLILKKPYSIDLRGHRLTVNGTLKYADSSDADRIVEIGTLKKKQYVNDGIVTADVLDVDITGSFNVHSILSVKELNIKAKNSVIGYGLEVDKSISVNSTDLTIADNVTFGENAIVSAVNSTLTVNGRAAAKYDLKTTKMFTTAETITNSVLLDENSELLMKGTAKGDITGGKKVIMSKTSRADNVSGMTELWVHDDSEIGAVYKHNGMVVKRIIELVAPPTLSVRVDEQGRILVSVKTVSNAKRYECKVGDAVLPIISADGSESIVVFDITDQAKSSIGDIRISVRALGAEGVDEELVVPSLYTSITYVHSIKLEMPSNVTVNKTDAGYTLTFNAVNFANKYRIEINGKNVIETKDTAVDITEFLDKVGNYSIFVYAINDENPAITNSEKALTGIEVRGKLIITEKSTVINEDGSLTLNINADNAKSVQITYTNENGDEITKIVAYSSSINLGKLSAGSEIKITLLGHGYYDESAVETLRV